MLLHFLTTSVPLTLPPPKSPSPCLSSQIYLEPLISSETSFTKLASQTMYSQAFSSQESLDGIIHHVPTTCTSDEVQVAECSAGETTTTVSQPSCRLLKTELTIHLQIPMPPTVYEPEQDTLDQSFLTAPQLVTFAIVAYCCLCKGAISDRDLLISA